MRQTLIKYLQNCVYNYKRKKKRISQLQCNIFEPVKELKEQTFLKKRLN